MSLSSFLSIARSALLTQQRAMDVTAHNVANAQTPGYSRQRLAILAAEPQWGPYGTIGRGVTAGLIGRVRDPFLDASYRRESGHLGTASTLSSFLAQVEGALAEPSDAGIAAALDDLFNGFADLANAPSNGATRDLVRQAAGRLVQRMHNLDTRICQASTDALERMRAEVASVNSLVQRIAELNRQILTRGSPGQNAPDLADQRDVLVDQLSSLVDVRVLQRNDGSLGVIVGDALLVDGGMAQELAVRQTASGGYTVGLASGTAPLGLREGSLKALTDLVGTILPGLRAELDTLARALVIEVNAVHRTGYTLAGVTGTDFFDPARVTAATIALAPAIAASGDGIAAAGTPAPGDGTVALLLSGLGSATVAALGGQTLRGYYTRFAAAVGGRVVDAGVDADTAQTLMENADAQRLSVSGVSLDEEMVNLIGQQQAYGAAARLVSVADEMVQEILRMI